MPPDAPGARVAENESIFRELNEHLGATARGGPSDAGAFVCECADMSCTFVLTVPLDEYEAVRQVGEWFIVAPDDAHVAPGLERVVARHDGYWVVEKLGVAADVADELDPRS